MSATGTALTEAFRLQYEASYGRRPGRATDMLAWLQRRYEHALQAEERNETLLRDLAQRIVALRQVLQAHKRCRVCGRELRRPDSVARGIGPECLTKGE